MNSNDIVVVTGGESGIGAATCRRLAPSGASIVIAGIQNDNGRSIEAELREQGYEATFMETDVSSEKSVQKLAQMTRITYGDPTVVVNNAGVALVKCLHETNEDEFDHLIGVNLKGIYLTSRVFVPSMLQNGKGIIVNIASQLGVVAAPRFAVYAATKGAVINLTKAMAVDYASHGIRVNCVCPGAVETPLLLNQFADTSGPQGSIDDLIGMHPIGRIGKPDEIAAAIEFLCAEGSSFMTGSAVVVDGGYTTV